MKNENKLTVICTIAIIASIIFGIFIISNNTQKVKTERTLTVFDVKTGNVIYAQNGFFETQIEHSELVIRYEFGGSKMENRVFLNDNTSYVIEEISEEIPYDIEFVER